MKNLVINSKVTNRETLSFNQYLKDIASINVLTPQQEAILAEKASKGDKKAVDELVRRNLRFVVSVAKQYATPQNPLEDLVNEGNIGLIIAAEKFNPDMGFKFISYAVWWVRKIIMEHLSKHGRLVRLPANKINSLSKLDKEITELEQRFGRNVTIQEAIDIMGNSGNYDSDYLKKKTDEYEFLDVLSSYHMDSLDRDISGDDGNGTILSDTISDESMFKSADHDINKADVKNELNKVLDTLKPRDKKVMIALFGLDGSIPRTLKDIGEEIGVTREMVRQIKEKCLNKMRVQMENSELN
jgi:RNA polymerase primary sigma factor